MLDKKIETRLSSNLWYHSTLLSDFKSICKKGIVVDFNKGNELDFGYGFYLSPSEKDAENYIKRLFTDSEDDFVVIEFEFSPLMWFVDSEFNTRVLSEYDDEFAEFVFLNRTENANGDKQHGFDAIYGVMSDSSPVMIIQDYRAKVISREEGITAFKKSTSAKQLSLHSQKLCDIIEMRRAYVFDKSNMQRRELNICDYGK